MKKRSQIKLLALFAGSLIMVGPILALTSCSSAATPHGPSTNITVSSVYSTLAGDYEQGDGFEHQLDLSYGDASSNDAISRTNIPNVPADIPYSLGDANAKYTKKDATEDDIRMAAFYYNEYYLNEMITQGILSAAASLVNFAAHNLITESIVDSGNAPKDHWGETKWTETVYKQLVDDGDTDVLNKMGQLREFMAAWVLGAGSGSNTYHIWPKNISYTLEYAGYNSLGHQTENLHDEPLGFKPKSNLEKLRDLNDNVIVSNIVIDFGWYKTAKSGGSWVTNIDALQKQTHDAGTWSNLDYNIPTDPVPAEAKYNKYAGQKISIKPTKLDYNLKMSDMELTTAKTYYAKKDDKDDKDSKTTDVYSGLLEMASPLTDDFVVAADSGSFLKFNAFDVTPPSLTQPYDVAAFKNTNDLINEATLTTDLKANDWNSIKNKMSKYVTLSNKKVTSTESRPGLYQILSFDFPKAKETK